jgi:hypothetical protein
MVFWQRVAMAGKKPWLFEMKDSVLRAQAYGMNRVFLVSRFAIKHSKESVLKPMLCPLWAGAV